MKIGFRNSPLNNIGQPIIVDTIPLPSSITDRTNILASSVLESTLQAPESLEALVTSMKSHPSTTLGWDVICSYDETRLNDILLKQFQTIPTLTTIKLGDVEKPFHVIYTPISFGDITGMSMKIFNSFHFELQFPKLKFTLDNHASLTIPIKTASENESNLSLILLPDDEQHITANLLVNTWYKKNPQGEYSKIKYSDVLKITDKNEINNIYTKFQDKELEEIEKDYNNKWFRLSSVKNLSPNLLGEENYYLEVVVPLTSVKGEGDQKQISRDILTFTGSNEKAKVVLHFDFDSDHGKTASINILGSKGTLPILNTVPALLDHLKLYFSQSLKGVDLVLAQVNTNTSNEKVAITPQSFIFSAERINETQGVLSLYILTKEYGYKQGAPTPSFMIGNTQACPIPKTHTMSLILSRDMMAKFFISQLGEQNFQLETSGDYQVPIELKGKYKNSVKIDVGDISVDKSWPELYEERTINRISVGTVDLKEYTVNSIKFKSDNTVDIDLHSEKTSNIHLHGTILRTSPDGFSSWGNIATDDKYDANVIANYQKNIALSKQLIGQNLQFGFKINSTDFNFSIDAKIKSNWFVSNKDLVDSAIKEKMSKVIKDISISLQPLNTFVVSNLLFNDNKSKIELDIKLGVQFPLDVVLVGNIKDK